MAYIIPTKPGSIIPIYPKQPGFISLLNDSGRTRSDQKSMVETVRECCASLPAWVDFLVSKPIVAGAADTSTSDLVIQPGSLCLTRALFKCLLGGSNPEQESLVRSGTDTSGRAIRRPSSYLA